LWIVIYAITYDKPLVAAITRFVVEGAIIGVCFYRAYDALLLVAGYAAKMAELVKVTHNVQAFIPFLHLTSPNRFMQAGL
jgi:hypothetical protein